jgi:hypothetical protein
MMPDTNFYYVFEQLDKILGYFSPILQEAPSATGKVMT